MPQTTTIPRDERHEALTLRLIALHRHAEAIGARQPRGPLPDETRVLAEALLFDIRSFLGQRGLPVAAPTYGGLAAQLGASVAALDAWEARHTEWDAQRKCIIWRIEGEPVPVQRLRPEPALVPGRSAKDQQRLDHMRKKIGELIHSRYDEGYTDALAGRPHRDERPSPHHVVKADASSSR